MKKDITVVGLDLAKSVFQVHGIGADGEVVVRRKLSRLDRLRLSRQTQAPDTSRLLSWILSATRLRISVLERQVVVVAGFGLLVWSTLLMIQRMLRR